jgi:hypothetical protein
MPNGRKSRFTEPTQISISQHAVAIHRENSRSLRYQHRQGSHWFETRSTVRSGSPSNQHCSSKAIKSHQGPSRAITQKPTLSLCSDRDAGVMSRAEKKKPLLRWDREDLPTTMNGAMTCVRFKNDTRTNLAAAEKLSCPTNRDGDGGCATEADDSPDQHRVNESWGFYRGISLQSVRDFVQAP